MWKVAASFASIAIGSREILDGPIEFPLALIGGAAKSEGRCVVGVEPERLVEVLYGPIELILLLEREAPTVEGGREFWIELDRLVVVFDRATPCPVRP